MKRNMLAMAAAAAAVLALAVSYSYSADQTRRQGFEFGVELDGIQAEVKELQDGFYSEKVRWEEGEITRDELLEAYGGHAAEFGGIVAKYGTLRPPPAFEAAVELLRLSSQAQLDSDIQYIEWLRTGEDSAKVRSDSKLQEALEYELLGLVQYYTAKTGVAAYDDEPFTPQDRGVAQKAAEVASRMEGRCDDLRAQDGDEAWRSCMDEAQRWRADHLP